jgi:thioredoxin reductase (NADPH)
MGNRVLAHPKIKVRWNSVVREILGEKGVEAVTLADTITGETERFPVNGVFVAIGHIPNTGIFADSLKLDERGYLVLRGDGTTATDVPGVFAAGDVADSRYRQAVSAAGSGCMAALDAQHYLEALAE